MKEIRTSLVDSERNFTIPTYQGMQSGSRSQCEFLLWYQHCTIQKEQW